MEPEVFRKCKHCGETLFTIPWTNVLGCVNSFCKLWHKRQ